MKQILNKTAMFAFTLLLFAPLALLAQDEKEKAKDKEVKEKKEAEQIVITLKGDKKEKVTVEVNGDNITVNGKPLSEYKDDNITVNRHKVRDRVALSKTDNGNWNYNFNDGNTYRIFSGDENRAMLGVTTEKTEQGVEIHEITKESAAEKAGLKKGDIITKVDDVKITDPDVLSKTITSHKPGDKVTVTYLRDKKEQKATAELTKWKGLNAYGLTPGHDFKFDMGDLNLKLEDLKGKTMTIPRTDAFGQWNSYAGRPKLGLSVQDTEDGKGVKVIEVDDGGTAKTAGIKANDIITEVDGKAVKSADEVAKIVRESKDKASLMFKLQRDGKTQNIEVKIPKKLKTADL